VKLYSFYRSSAAYRVRIALNLKGVSHEIVSRHLTKGGGEHLSAEFQRINPQMRVPALVLNDGSVLTQSLAIIEYLDETHPQPPLLPRDAQPRAQVRAVAQIIASDIHPLNNLAPLRYLHRQFGQDQGALDDWYRHWIAQGFAAIEALIAPGPFAFGASVTLADLCLVPQVYNARRYKLSLDAFPKIVGVDAACQKLDAFANAAPERQPDAE
jgi:maleylpyruvate isomerase